MGHLIIKKTMLKKLLLCLLALSLVNCSTHSALGVSPTKALNSPAQYYLQSSAHWSTVAKDITEHVSVELKNRHVDVDTEPVYIAVNSGSSDFGIAMRDFIITNLVEKGFKLSQMEKGSKLSQTKNTAHVLEVKLQTVKFNSHRILATQSTPYNYAPDVELIVTSSLMKQQNFLQNFLMRSTSIYYVNVDDRMLYEKNKCRGPFNDSFFSKDC